MPREKQQFLTKPQMRALSYRIKFPLSSNIAVGRHAGVSAEICRKWFAPGGKSLPSECYNRHLSTGRYFEERKFKTAGEAQLANMQSAAIRDLSHRFEQLERKLGPVKKGTQIDYEKARKYFSMIDAGIDADDLN